jgi:hypothetical protein
MENNEISFAVLDDMIQNEPMRWQSFECDIENNPIHELFVDEIPEEYDYLFDECTLEEIVEIRDEILVCLN